MRVFGHFVLGSRVRLFVAEQAAAGVLFLAAVASGGLRGPAALAASVGCVLALQAAFYLADLYDPRHEVSSSRWCLAAGAGVLLASLVWALAGSGRPGLWLAALALACVVTLLLRSLSLTRPQRAVVLGSGVRARAVARLAREGAHDAQVVGFVADGGPDDGLPSPLPLLLDREGQIDQVARRMGADLVVVASEQPVDEEALARARAMGLEVVSAAGFAARFGRRLPPELLAPSELVYGEGFGQTRVSDLLQRTLDVAASFTLLLLASPVLLLAMLAIKLDSPGPVFYSQERVGKGGKTYRVTKLRSMRVDAEAAGQAVWAQKNDPRVTRIGRFLRMTRIDELPQVFAVLKGDMSIVGPRPERPIFVAELKKQLPLYGLREAVKPGVTGWAQICYPYGATVEDAKNKLEYDLYYLRHRSFFLNLAILFHTVRTVLTARGAR